MPIPFNRYVMITSGVGGGGDVARRDLIARLFTTSSDIPTGTVMEFRDAEAVGEFFGTSSEEFMRAQFYFGFTSKLITRPSLISFYRWTNTAAAATIYGGSHAVLSALQAITAGTFDLTIGTSTQSITALDFSSANSLSDVAAVLQTRIRTLTGAPFTAATVVFNAEFDRFEFTAGNTDTAVIRTSAGSSNDAASTIGFLSNNPGILFSAGAAAASITDALTMSAQVSNNFGSFAFLPELTQDQVVEAATWNNGQNNLYQYHVPVSAANAQAYSTALIGLAGTGITLDPGQDNQWLEMLPMAVLAATDYTRRAATQNFMFQVASLTASVNTRADADLYDGLRINYYGETQTAGQIRRFYQRGVLTGNAASVPVDMGVYANEQWFKDDAGARAMTLLISQSRVPANQTGRGELLAIIQSSIDQAVLNGTIQAGATLTDTQRLFITERSGDPIAYQQVQSIGYWIDAEIQRTTTSDNRVEFKANYDLIYTVDNAIRQVCGTHTLI